MGNDKCESTYKVGDRVLIKDHIVPGGAMVEFMLEEHGGKVRTISKVIPNEHRGEFWFTYEIEEDETPYRYEFMDEDIAGLHAEELEVSQHVNVIPQRIEIPVPGGHLVAVTTDYGGDYPGIHVFFVASGDTVEHNLCFAEVCAEHHPDEIRVGTCYADCDEVKDISVYPMSVWDKEEE